MDKKDQTSPWGEYTLLILVTLLAASLRVYKLGDLSYFIDEFRTWDHTLNLASRPLSRLFYPNSYLAFFLLTKLSLTMFGESALALRFFPCVFGILTIPLVYFPIKRLFDTYVSLTAVLMIAVSPWHIYMSQMARWYTLLLLVSFLAIISFYFFIESGKKKYLFFYIILSYFAVTVHLTAFFIPIIAVSYLLFLIVLNRFQNQAQNTKTLVTILVLHIIVFLAFVPKLVGFIEYWREIEGLVGSWGNDLTLKALYLLTPSIVFGASTGLYLLLALKDRRGLFLTTYSILPFISLGVLSLLNLNVSARYLLFTLPAAAIAAGFTISYVRIFLFKNSTLLFLSILVITILPSVQTDYLYFTSEYGYRQRSREAFQYVKKRIAKDDQLFVAGIYPPYEQRFYAESLMRVEGIDINDGQLITTNLPETLDLGKRTWVITLGRAAEDPEGFRKWIAEHTRLLAEFPARRGAQDQTLKVHLYAP